MSSLVEKYDAALSELKGKLLEKHLEKDLKMNYRIFLTSTQGDSFAGLPSAPKLADS